MRLLVTGANGFLGSRVVVEALRRGHEVRAMVRPASALPGDWPAGRDALGVARYDLRSKRGLVEAVRGVDAVVHLAAAKTGDLYAQLAGTVVATENLLEAMAAAEVPRLVHVSSFAVYDYRRIRGTLDERSPLEARPDDRDDYAKTKLLQEQMVRDHCEAHSTALTVLRPGAVFGPENEWTSRVGFRLGRTWVLTGLWARIPLTHVENCATAIVLAAERPEAIGETLNVVDDDLPTQWGYARELRRHVRPRPRLVPVPWTVMRVLAGLAMLTRKLFLGPAGKLPGVLVPAKLYAMAKPLRYSNAELKRVLEWKPRLGWKEALAAGFASAPDSAPEDPVGRGAEVRGDVGH